MPNRISISRAILAGLLFVNGPVLILLVGPLSLFALLVDRGLIARSWNWFGLVVFLSGFLLAWLWWSLTIPRWRLWAYERVDDIPALKSAAVSAGLTWPDGHLFSRTEIKSRSHAARERAMDPAESDAGKL